MSEIVTADESKSVTAHKINNKPVKKVSEKAGMTGLYMAQMLFALAPIAALMTRRRKVEE